MEEVVAKLNFVLVPNSTARRESREAVLKLEEQIKACGQDQVIEQIAYTWFNRFCALRFMDVNRYTRIGIVSPALGQFQPEILAEAKMGHMDEDIVPHPTQQKVADLLSGSAPSPNAQTEAYRLLVVAACNGYHKIMPYLFERIDDYTELLMPEDLLSGNSILAYTREAMTPDVCKDVEVLGWLYQFYISEKKDEVFTDLKKNRKITPEKIPAATQLFTPHWIVRYLVENSLGRLWMLNRPKSRLIEQMEYYIQLEQPETDFLRINKPEEIKICDPACGSGHMLVYAFDLLNAIYEEEGYEPSEIPEKILTHNLYGIEIDERAGALAAFALTMKARAKQRRFFRKPIQPHICVLENIQFADGELNDYMNFIGRDLFTATLLETLHQFREADNFGSLIRPIVKDVKDILRLLEERGVGEQLLLYQIHHKVLKALQQTDYLSSKYHVVVANPPYMGGKGMNGRLSEWVKKNYPDSRSDMMTCFMERGIEFASSSGYLGMINLPSWMFLSSFENLRLKLLSNSFIETLLHLGRGIFGSDFGTVAFTLKNAEPAGNQAGTYKKLFEEHVQVRSVEKISQIFFDKSYKTYIVSQLAFKKIPGSPIAYWVSPSDLKAFETTEPIEKVASVCIGMKTGDNEKFLRYWYEVSNSKIGYYLNSIDDANHSSFEWFPYLKGGDFRKWHGNYELILNWVQEGENIKNHVNKHGISDARIRPSNFQFYFHEGINWSFITSGSFGVRIHDKGFFFDVAGSSLFAGERTTNFQLASYLNSKVTSRFLAALNPTLNMQIENIKSLPSPQNIDLEKVTVRVQSLKSKSKSDWDAYETSWDFTTHPLIHTDCHQITLKATYSKLRAQWQSMTDDMKHLEEENNRFFIEAYGFQNELIPEVSLNEITLTCNPHYRYGGGKTIDALEASLLTDTMKEFISYSVGCMFGRYSLDKPGLILANQGETIEHYLQQIPNPTFPADTDNVIPMLDGDWFPDDISERFRKFLRVTFGEENYDANLKFIEKALGKDIRRYFLRDFYNDHIRRYKKRPIYWLFSSPKGTFNALIYMHRYRPDTVGIVLNDYLREFRTKLVAHRNHLEQVSISTAASATEKTKALKEIESLRKAIDELESYEREVLYPLATERVEIDLDDGVRINYGKFGAALKKIPGLEAVED
jgi:SAM-dependent methyltransferase